MKSYLKFLSRNKLYTAIEAAGLIVSLAFVVIISCYVWQQLAITRETPGYKNVYSLNMGGESFNARPGEMSIVQDRIPEVETASRVKKTNYFGKQISIDGQYIASKYNSVTEVDPSFFGFFPSTFVEGSEECLHDRNQLILEESFARLYFPDKDPMGKTVIIRTDTCIVGGIVRFPERSLLKEQYIIKGFKQPDEPTASTFFIPNDLVLLRFREGTDIEATRALIDTLIRKEFPNYSKSQVTFPIKDIYFSPNNNTDILNKGNRSMIYVLIAAGILLLVSALFNYINLSVALSNKRAKEMAIRSTLGESRSRIFGRYILESMIFMAVCLVLAIVLAKWLEPLFNRYVASDIGLDIAFSEPYLITYILMAVVVGAVSGIIPAFMVHRDDPVSIIKGSQRRQTKTVFSRVFIVIQNVITVTLISLAIVMELQYNHLVNAPLGADVSDLYFISSGTIGKDVFSSRPYINRAGITNGVVGLRNIAFAVSNEDGSIDIGKIECDETAFDIYGFEIVKDYHRSRQKSIWFTESAARAFNFDEENPVIPKSLEYFYKDREIGGIIKDFAVTDPSHFAANQVGMVIIDELLGQSTMILELNRLDKEVRADLKEIGRQESIRLRGDESVADNYGPVPELIERSMEETHNFIRLIELFMLVSVLISLLGLVAMSAYYAGLQTKGIAVRKVFGATVESETKRAVSEYMILVGIAIIIGIAIAIFLAERYLRQFWDRIEGYGWVFAVAAVITLLISFLAVLWQTLKAAKTNPAEELKKE